MSTMTLDLALGYAKSACIGPMSSQAIEVIEDYITHIAQPAQAVDVGAIREVLAEMERVLGDLPGWRSDIDKLTHAINAKA